MPISTMYFFEGTYKKPDTATPVFYLLLSYVSFYVSRYHFLQFFSTLFNIFLKKLLSFTPALPQKTLNSQNLLSIGNFLLFMLPNVILAA